MYLLIMLQDITIPCNFKCDGQGSALDNVSDDDIDFNDEADEFELHVNEVTQNLCL